MIIDAGQALRLAIEKYGPDVFVGTLNQVWCEARKRAVAAEKPIPGRIDTERLDGATWNDDLDEGSYVGVDDPLTDSENHYWFVLLPVKEYVFDYSIPWENLDQVTKWRFADKCQQIQSGAFTKLMFKYHTGIFNLVGNVSIDPEQEWSSKPNYGTENAWVDAVVTRFLVTLRQLNVIEG